MANNTPISLRTTQRAPRSCVSCSSRKVKCDKAIPCSTCINRGTADTCVRETVIVRGEVRIATDPPDQLSYEDLRRENERLRTELRTARESTEIITARRIRQRNLRCLESFERFLFEHIATAKPENPPKPTWSSIVVPSRACSEQLVEYDRVWNSWAHYALEYPLFSNEHDEFFSSLERGVPLEDMDYAWLSVYFSVLCAACLMMDDEQARKLSLPSDFSYNQICRHWYDAALFCLHESDFMRTKNIRSVQTIAILEMVFNNFGDPELGSHLWSCAIRIAQKLGIDNQDHQAVQPLSSQGQRRMWWTLVICEWMAVEYHPPRIEEGDFDMALPTPDAVSIHSEDVQPVYYHIFMCRVSTVYYRFRTSLREGKIPLEELVRRADEELAEVINTLPGYLQPDSEETEAIHKLEVTYPWVKWQRFDITLVLLHHRLRINRVLQRQWLSTPGQYESARSVCINSAIGIIWISSNWDQPATMRKQWALSLYLFVSAIFLLRESRGPISGPAEFQNEIETALSHLEEVASQTSIAFHAADILRAHLNKGSPLPS